MLTAVESIESMAERQGQVWQRTVIISGFDHGAFKELVTTEACLQGEENPVEIM